MWILYIMQKDVVAKMILQALVYWGVLRVKVGDEP